MVLFRIGKRSHFDCCLSRGSQAYVVSVGMCSKGEPSLHWANVVLYTGVRAGSTYPIPIVYSMGSCLENHMFHDNSIFALGTFITNVIFSYMGHLLRFYWCQHFFSQQFWFIESQLLTVHVLLSKHIDNSLFTFFYWLCM